MSIYLLDDSLEVKVYFEPDETDYDDDICVSFFESCKEDERIFRAGETHIYLTPVQARQLAEALLKAVDASLENCECGPEE
jgi:hypothetical protein